MFDSWIKLPKREDVFEIKSEVEITDLYNKIERNRELLQKVIMTNHYKYKEDGTPDYEIINKIEHKRNELLDILLSLISVTEYLIYKTNNISEGRIFHNIYFNNQLREAYVEITKAENLSFKDKVQEELNKNKELRDNIKQELKAIDLENKKLLYALDQRNSENIKKTENNFVTILGIFIAVFSIIQVNYNLFEKMSNLRLTDIILFASVVNLSIFSVIFGLFEVLKKYNNEEEKFSISLLLIPLLFIGLIIFCLNYRTICFFY